MLGKYHPKKKKTEAKKKKNLKKIVKYMVFFFVCFTAALDIHEVTDIKQFIFTASLLVHLFLGW